MSNKFYELERLIIGEFEVIKLMLQGAGLTTPKPPAKQDTLMTDEASYENYEYNNDVEENNQVNYTKTVEIIKNNTTKHFLSAINELLVNKGSLEVVNDTEKNTLSSKHAAVKFIRQLEIQKLNETIVDTDMGKAFVYYWRVENVKDLMKQDFSLSSPDIEYLGEVYYTALQK